MREPLFEFSGACAGCGETPYIKLMTQLFGDRAIIANATGCSSIYGGNLPTTPYTTRADGRGPAWSNSLFEDAAEFGIRHAALRRQEAWSTPASSSRAKARAFREPGRQAPRQRQAARTRHRGPARRGRRAQGRHRQAPRTSGPRSSPPWPAGPHQEAPSGSFGGDGWAYDIGFGGLDHVLASGRNINILVLDTEVYSNTGGQASKATPIGAVAKFATAGKDVARRTSA